MNIRLYPDFDLQYLRDVVHVSAILLCSFPLILGTKGGHLSDDDASTKDCHPFSKARDEISLKPIEVRKKSPPGQACSDAEVEYRRARSLREANSVLSWRSTLSRQLQWWCASKQDKFQSFLSLAWGRFELLEVIRSRRRVACITYIWGSYCQIVLLDMWWPVCIMFKITMFLFCRHSNRSLAGEMKWKGVAADVAPILLEYFEFWWEKWSVMVSSWQMKWRIYSI